MNLHPWIKLNTLCYKSILSCICQGIVILNKQDSAQGTKLNDSFRKQDQPSLKVSSSEDKKRSKPPPPPIPSSKLAQKLQEFLGTSYVSIQPNVNSKSDPELSTFSILTAEIDVKNAAEICMTNLFARPLKENSQGFLHSSTFDELQAVSEIIDLQHQLIKNVDHEPINIKQIGSFLRYFSFQNQIIFGILELPAWALNHSCPSGLNKTNAYEERDNPQVVMIVRDMSGRYCWLEKLNYGGKQAMVKQNSIDFNQLNRFTPSQYPYVPKNSQVIHALSHNESSIPKMNDIVSHNDKQHYERTKKLVSEQSIHELNMFNSKSSRLDLFSLKNFK